MNVSVNLNISSAIILIVLGVVLGAFFAGKLQINLSEKVWVEIKTIVALLVSFSVLAATLFLLHYRFNVKFTEAWAISYLLFVSILTLFMCINFIPNPEIRTGLTNRFTGKELVLSLSQVLWLSVAFKLMLLGVSE